MEPGLNWVDLVIIILLAFYFLEGFSLGLLASIWDLLSFIASFIFGLTFYNFFGRFLITNFSIPQGFANAIGFFLAAFIAEIAITFLIRRFAGGIKFTVSRKSPAMDKVLGGLASMLSGLVLASFILTLVVSLPLSAFLKNSVSESKIGRVLTSNTQGLAKNLNDVFGGAVNESLSFLTVEPKSGESVNLNFKTSNIKVDPVAEEEMFNLVNNERISAGLPSLGKDARMAEVGRDHCTDMFRRGYFSHYTPEGLSPFDRMSNAEISFSYAGENLALAPNVDLAHKGLMQSPGHKANILNKNFGNVGIGVIDGGMYGQMYCQEFKD